MKAQRILTEAALLFFVAASTLNPLSVGAADFAFRPGELVLAPDDWQNTGSATEWSIQPPFIIHRESDRESALVLRHSIPAYFEITCEMVLDSVGRSDGKGIKLRTANASFAVSIDDDYPLGIYNVAAGKYRSQDVSLRLRTRHSYRCCFRVAPKTLTATVDSKTISAQWDATPPFTLSFFAQRGGYRVKSLKITEIKK